MYGNPALTRLRSALRSARVLRLIQDSPFYRFINQGYESRFAQAMLNSLEPGMRVFDIGANVGYYTEKFADRVGRSGRVHAFEPVPASANVIKVMVSARPWIEVHQCAVADQTGELLMDAEGGSTSPTNKIALSALDSVGIGMAVPVETIDTMAARVGIPAVIKIDVEGYEYYVLKGGRKTLLSAALRHVFVEVHFALLEQRGLANAPADISSTLAMAGFNVKFTDPSHIHASRRS